MKVYGAFNIKTNQFLGLDKESYLIRDDLRTLVVWGEMDTETGRFVVTRNPIRYIPDENGNGGLSFTEKGEMTGIELDNTSDYTGSSFFDSGYMSDGHGPLMKPKDVTEYAAHLSKEAKDAMIKSGHLNNAVRTSFFVMP